jgi:predicted DCC family thiol-disulfide oxidoreductase YuxK
MTDIEVSSESHKPQWTGGQYSLYRGLLALVTGTHFAVLLAAGDYGPTRLVRDKWTSHAPESLDLLVSVQAAQSAAVIGMALCLPLFLGALDRLAAFLLMLFAAALFLACTSPLSLVVLAWLFFCHLMVPGAPLLSLSSGGREDPAGDWRMPESVIRFSRAVVIVFWGFAAVWLYKFGSGIENLPLAVIQLVAAMLLLHLLVSGPGLAAATPSDTGIRLFYDGNCGLCHQAVRVVLAEDVTGDAFRFAPLGGDAFMAELSDEQRSGLPDSMVVVTPSGNVLTRSDSALFVARRLGGVWRVLAVVLVVCPRPLRDFAYNRIAAIRGKLFAKPEDSCPLLPESLRGRFDS